MQELLSSLFQTTKDSRIKRVVEKFDLDYVARALKPTARGSN